MEVTLKNHLQLCQMELFSCRRAVKRKEKGKIQGSPADQGEWGESRGGRSEKGGKGMRVRSSGGEATSKRLP